MEPNFPLPAIPVNVLDLTGGPPGRMHKIICANVPRVGEVIYPEGGSPVVVRVVIWKVTSGPEKFACMVPMLYVSEPTQQERALMTVHFPV